MAKFLYNLPSPLSSVGSSQPSCDSMDLGIGGRFYIQARQTATLLAYSSHTMVHDPERNVPNYPALERHYLFRLGPHPLRAAYEAGLADRICSAVQSSGLPWTLFGAYRQGFSPKEGGTVPTVLIMATPTGLPVETPMPMKKLEVARLLANKVEKLLSDCALPDVHVAIAVMNCGTAYASSEPTSIKVRREMACMHNPVRPGNSIGVVGQTFAGTFSGCIRIEQAVSPAVAGLGAGPRADVYGLTCHHVVAPGRRDFFAAISSNDELVKVLSPAAHDHQDYVAHLREEVARARVTIAEAVAAKEEAELIGRKTTRLENVILENHASLETMTSILERVERHWQQGSGLGTVLLSSGVDTPAEGKGLEDWALLWLDAERMRQQQNEQLPASVYDEYASHTKRACSIMKTGSGVCSYFYAPDSEWLNDGEAEPVVPQSQIPALAKAEAPTYVFLRGRSTAFGVGILHDVCDTVCTRYGPPGHERVLVSRELTALDIPYADQAPHPEDHIRCSRKGDSGAPVRLSDGRILGVIVASNPNDALGRPSSHITVGETLLANIKAATGASRVSFVGMNSATGGP